MRRDRKGNYRVSPLDVAGCDGVGPTLEDAAEASRAAMTEFLSKRRDEMIIPPMITLTPNDLIAKRMIRIDVELE